MSLSINADVIRLIIQEAANEAETSFSHSTIDAFYQRSTTLRRFSLVNFQWRSLAQLELQSYVVLTNRNQRLAHCAIVKTGLAKRVRRLLDRRGTGVKDERLFSEILEKCEGLRELDCWNSRFALSSLLKAKGTLFPLHLFVKRRHLINSFCLHRSRVIVVIERFPRK